MLIRFQVSNFRSIKEEQALDLDADPADKTSLEQKAFTPAKKFIPPVLRATALFGANASGKSNVIKALQQMRNMVTNSPHARDREGRNLYTPFMLDPGTIGQPTRLGVTVLLEGEVYDYSFSYTGDRIVTEKLSVYTTSHPRLMFDRAFKESVDGVDHYAYKFGQAFLGPKKTYEQITRSDVLFLTSVILVNNTQLLGFFNWFKSRLVTLNELELATIGPLSRHGDNPEYKSEIIRFLDSADISISDFRLRKYGLGAVPSGNGGLVPAKVVVTPEFEHRNGDYKANFLIADESRGTKRLLELFSLLHMSFSNPMTLVIDELENSLHPSIIEFIVRQFYGRNGETGNSQLIFSTHCDSLLCNIPGQSGKSTAETSLFRRDQIWFVNKANDQSSWLVPLLAFKPRKRESVFDGYRQGRYVSVPYTSDYRPESLIPVSIEDVENPGD